MTNHLETFRLYSLGKYYIGFKPWIQNKKFFTTFAVVTETQSSSTTGKSSYTAGIHLLVLFYLQIKWYDYINFTTMFLPSSYHLFIWAGISKVTIRKCKNHNIVSVPFALYLQHVRLFATPAARNAHHSQ